MEEKKFEELLLKNNQNLIQEMDKKFEKNNQILMQEVDKKFKKNNQILIQEVDKKFDKNNQILMQEMDKKIEESEERQNAKLAYLEYTYGEKISAIFDKIQSIEDIMKRNEEENKKYKKAVDRHGDILYSHDFRISKLEDKFSST